MFNVFDKLKLLWTSRWNSLSGHSDRPVHPYFKYVATTGCIDYETSEDGWWFVVCTKVTSLEGPISCGDRL